MTDTFRSLHTKLADAILSVPAAVDLPAGVAVGSVRYVVALSALYQYDGSSWSAVDSGGGGGGGITGPVSSTLNALARWGATDGTAVKNSPIVVTDAGAMSGVTTVNLTTIPSSKTLTVTTDNLSVFAATTSAQLAGIISDETGSGALVFATSPTLVTPVLGVATATSINGSTIPSSKTLVVTTDNLSVMAATTSAQLAGVISDETGSGALVFATSPTLVTPVLGVATATSINGSTIPSSKTLVVTTDNLSVLAATTSAQLAGVISDETGSGSLVFATSPTLVTPILGVAAATTINKVALTAPATGSTLTIADGKTLTASNTLTFTGTDTSSVAFGAGGTVAYTANKLSAFAATTSLELAGVISDETGSGALVFATSPTLVTPLLGTPTSGNLANCTGLTIAGGGTGASTKAGAFDALSPMTTAQDMIIGGTSGTGLRANTALLGDVSASSASAVVTMTSANPGVVSHTAHGRVTGDKVYFTSTGNLPTALTGSTTYYVVSIDANSYSLALTMSNALAGTKINTTAGTQTGTHTAFVGGLVVSAASTSAQGIVTIAAQSIAGVKTFTDGLAGKVTHSDNAGAADTNGTTLMVRSGRYTPTLTGTGNVTTSAVSSNSMLWYQIGSIVHCEGVVSVTVTAAAPTDTTFTLTLPVTPTSNFSGSAEAAGVGTFVASTTVYNAVTCFSSNAAKTALVEFAATTGAGVSHTLLYSFSYKTN